MSSLAAFFSNGVLIMFLLYMLLMIGIGFIFCKRVKSVDDYLLGNRGVGSWVTALSAQASDMSGWMLMGLPGAIYIGGMGDAWVAIGLAAGTLLNWLLVAPRLRIYTAKTGALTLSSFFAVRFRDPSGALRIISSIIVLIFFTIYAASGLVASGKLFNTMFGLNFKVAVLIGAFVILVYTFLGGYLAVCWTDLFQGILMFIAIVAVPVMAIYANGGVSPILDSCQNRGISLFPGQESSLTWLGIVSCAVWGLGYFGQPHILSRFMSVSDIKLLPKSTLIAMIWVVISLSGAVAVGLAAVKIFPSETYLPGGRETVFIELIKILFNPWIAGIFLAAIMAAIMSTIDSQLLVTSSTLTEDFYRRVIHREALVGESVFVSRMCVLIVTIVATVMALTPNDTIFNIVKFAWGGFGAAFGPVVIMALYSRRTTWISALCGMISGTTVMIVWYLLDWNAKMYEILPGFIAGLLTIIIIDFFLPQKNAEVLSEFDESRKQIVGFGKKTDEPTV